MVSPLRVANQERSYLPSSLTPSQIRSGHPLYFGVRILVNYCVFATNLFAQFSSAARFSVLVQPIISFRERDFSLIFAGFTFLLPEVAGRDPDEILAAELREQQ
jgi:hypothetical protein